MDRYHLPRVILAILFCLPTLAIAATDAATDADPITDAVSEAEQSFRLSVVKQKQELNQRIKAIIERETQLAVDAGDLDALESLKAQLKAYEADGTYPDLPATRSHVQRYQNKLTRLGDDLIKAYELATRRYTQARDIENARLMKDKINWTRPTAELDTVARDGSVYMLVREKKTWTEAKAECEKLGGYLACLNSKSEHRFIYEKLTKGKNITAWLGGTDAHKEGDWVWLDGTNDYWAWARNEPSNWNNIQHYAGMTNNGALGDFQQVNRFINAYICEWDYAPTRETVYQTEEDAKRESAYIEALQAATLKHNELVVSERKRLQSAILAADDETAIVDAKAGYNDRVVSIKQNYIEQLQGALKRTLAEDRLEIASNIKTQVLRVEGQVRRLSKDDTGPDVPTLDDGRVETKPEQQPSEDGDGNSHDQDPAHHPTDDADDTGTFFGIPLK